MRTGRPHKEYSETEKREVAEKYKQSQKIKEKSRLLVIKLRVCNGMKAEKISEITGYTKNYVEQLISDYQKCGIEKILAKKQEGHHRNMTEMEEREFLDQFKKEAEKGKMLEVSEIIKAYKEAVGKESSKSTVYALLRRNDWRKIMPRSRHEKKASDEAIEAYKKNEYKNQ